MDTEISFTKIEFLIVIVSITYGFCVVDILTNWSRIIRRRAMYWETMLWSIILFIAISVLWYNSWDHIKFIERSSGFFISALIPPIGLFVMISALFPDHSSEWDLEAMFMRNRKMFFLMFALVNVFVLILSNAITDPPLILNYIRSIWAVACILMYFVDSKILRSLLGGGLLCWYVYLIVFSGM